MTAATSVARVTGRTGLSGLTGTGALLRLAMRRDRVLIPVSAVVLAGFVVSAAQATLALYPDLDSAAAGLEEAINSPALLAMYGPLTGHTLGAFAVFKVIVMGAAFVALLGYIVVRRHTRTEEESGRLEMLGATVIGRRAPLTAAVLLASGAVVLTSVLAGLGLVSVGLDATGSAAFAVCWMVAGLVWVGVTAVAAQLTETARGTATISLAALALAYLLRAVADTSAEGSPLRLLTWLSPLGWAEHVAPFGANRFWILAPALVVTVALVGLAFSLLERRDLGAGILPSRPGPASSRIARIGGLTTRLARGTTIGWAVTGVLLGAAVGSIAGNVGSIASSPETEDFLRKLGGNVESLTDVFYSVELRFVALAVAGLGLALVTRLRSEETAGRAEAVLATRVTRVRWALAHLGVALAATTIVMALVGLSAGLLDAGNTGDLAHSVGRLMGASLATLPAIWVCTAVGLLLVGFAPRQTGLVWAFLLAVLTLGEFGSMLRLPQWLINVSPFVHLPVLPGGTATATPYVVLTVIAAVIAAVGVVGLRRRDLPVG